MLRCCTRALPCCVADASPGKRAGGSNRGWGDAGEEEFPVGEGPGLHVQALMEMKDARSRAWVTETEGVRGRVRCGGGWREDAGSRWGAVAWGHLELEVAVGRDKFQAVPTGGGGLAGPWRRSLSLSFLICNIELMVALPQRLLRGYTWCEPLIRRRGAPGVCQLPSTQSWGEGAPRTRARAARVVSGGEVSRLHRGSHGSPQ